MRAAQRFFLSRRNLYILGFVLVFLLSLSEVLRGKHFNFLIFANSTVDFWNGIVPYGLDWAAKNHDQFLYGPLFSVLFAPFAFLPGWLGPFVWNVFNFTMLFIAIFTLPDKYSNEQKCKTFLYIFLILATTQLSFQYNVAVAYMFIFAFSLLERGRNFWAILLILISGFTKIYGIFQLGLLLCYPHFWRNMGYTVAISAGLFFMPLLKLAPSELIPYYGKWFDALTTHTSLRTFQSIWFAKPLLYKLFPIAKTVQIIAVAVLGGLLVAGRRRYPDFAYRAQVLGILMGWIILFGDSSEKHTYVIALLGYMLWYWSRTPGRFDKILFWANFILLCVVPVDVLCPPPVMRFICDTLFLNVWVFLFTWLRMVYITMIIPLASPAKFPDPVS